MIPILLKSASLVCFIILGYVLKRVGLFGPEDYRIPVKIVMNITMPCAAIVSFASYRPDLSLLLATVIGFSLNCLMLAAAWFVSRGKERAIRAIWLNCVPGFNIGAFAMPFIQSFLAPASLVGTCLFDTGSALMCNGTTYAISRNLLDGSKGLNLKRIGITLLHSVPFLTYFILLLVTLAKLPIPQGIVNFITPAANANAFMAMLMVGMMLDLNIEKAYLKQMAGILALRYSITIVAAALCYFCLPLPIEIRQALAITVFAPVGMVSTALCVKAGGDPAVAAGTNSLSILISVPCIIGLLVIFGAL